jgi:deoxyribodipyrimidine photo-lyase
MTTVIHWFRHDLRLADNAAFSQACAAATHVLPVWCHDPSLDVMTAWGFARTGPHRRRFVADTLGDLAANLAARGSGLVELHGRPRDVLPALARAIGADRVTCEAIAAPEELDEIAALRAAGLAVDATWQSTLLDPLDLPFEAERVPDVFTAFRSAVERSGVIPPAPIAAPARIPPLPALPDDLAITGARAAADEAVDDPRSSFPYRRPAFSGGETAALAHLDRYFARRLAHTYKATRNGLTGTDFSTKFSPWLATGALSARTIRAALRRFETDHGANDGTYWIWFELLWRDHFRLLHLKHGSTLYRARDSPLHHHRHTTLRRSRAGAHGETGEPLVDAGMRELAATGWLSNRMRQIVASWLVNDLACDWRAGAAWFEAQLVDYDVHSKHGQLALYRWTRHRSARRAALRSGEAGCANTIPDSRYRNLWAAP